MTRFEWKIKKMHLPFNYRYFLPAIKVFNTIIIVLYSIWLVNSAIKPIYRFEQYTIAKELERQEKYIRESEEQEIKEAQDYIERLEIQKKHEQEEKSRIEMEHIIKECAKKFKIGDRIKIYDMDAPMIKESDKYRWSIGDIDIIKNIVGYKIYCESGKVYNYNEQIEKVRSKREWKDLVNMQIRGEINFLEE